MSNIWLTSNVWKFSCLSNPIVRIHLVISCFTAHQSGWAMVSSSVNVPGLFEYNQVVLVFSHLKWWTSLWASRLFSELWPAPPGSSSSLHGLNNQTQGTRMGLSLVDWRHPLILGISKKRSTKTRWMVANIDKLSQLHRPCDFFWVDSPQSQHVTAQRRSCSYPPAPKKSSRASSIHLPYGCMQTAWLPAPLNIFKYLQLSSTHSSKWIKMFVVHF